MTSTDRTADLITFDDIRRAARRLDGVAHRTPVLTSRRLDERVGAHVLLKAECFQRTGSFKFRGAYHAVAGLHAEQRARGVAAYSSGNHAQAVALAAALHGTHATILMPADAPPSKLAATRGYGAEVITYDRFAEDRSALGETLAAAYGATLIPPFDSWEIIAGQGTVALELLEDVGPLDLLLVSVGGGGLIAGCATAAKALSPGIRVIGVEPAAGDDLKRSLEAGRRVRIPVPRTIADGQQVDMPGARPFLVAQRLVDDVALVTDEEILDAMALLFETCKVVAEPSGASALAALLAGRVDATGLRVGVTISGGNISTERFARLFAGR
jgi:threo-3-hydroxy-L-aspartate ammonia-lyase